MKTENTDTITLPHGSMEYATAIPGIILEYRIMARRSRAIIKLLARRANNFFY